MRYIIADKYGVQGLKDASWDLIKLALTLIHVSIETFGDV